MATDVVQHDGGARFSLRVAEADLPAAEDAWGGPLPRRIGAASAHDGREALCIGPDEWMLTAPEEARAAVSGAFAGLDCPVSCVDISDRELRLRLAGAGARHLLALGCPLDFDALEPGGGTRTVFDGVPVVLRRDADGVTLDVWRSYAPHVRAVLAAGQREMAAGL